MLTRSGPFNKKQLIQAALGYCDLYQGNVPYRDLDSGGIGYVIFSKAGVVWVFKELIKAL